MIIETTLLSVQNSYPGLAESSKFTGDLSKAKFSYDITDPVIVGDPPRDRSAPGYLELSLKEGHAYMHLAISEGRKRKRISMHEWMRSHGLPPEVRKAIEDMAETRRALDALPRVRVPSWDEDFETPYFQEYAIMGVFSESGSDFVAAHGPFGPEVFEIEADMLRYHPKFALADFANESSDPADLRCGKSAVPVNADPAAILALLAGRDILDFDNRSRSIHVGALLGALSGPGFRAFGEDPSAKAASEPLEIFDRAKIASAPTVPFSKEPSEHLLSLGLLPVNERPGAIRGDQFLNHLQGIAQAKTRSEAKKLAFLLPAPSPAAKRPSLGR